MCGHAWIEFGMRRKLGSRRRGRIRALASPEIPVEALGLTHASPLYSFLNGGLDPFLILFFFFETEFSLCVTKKVALKLIMGGQRWRF